MLAGAACLLLLLEVALVPLAHKLLAAGQKTMIANH